MPKKYKQSSLDTKPNYVHPSLGGGKQAAGPAPPSSITVNERLSQLRIAQASPGSADRKRELAERSTQKSLPPSLGQGILGHAPVAAPRPQAGARTRTRFRTPGPAPPPSWQNGSIAHDSGLRSAPRVARSFGKKDATERRRPETLARFPNLTGDNHVPRESLLHITLRSAAENWEAIAEDCLGDLEFLPVHLRAALLSYLNYYDPENGLHIRDLQGLFPSVGDATYLDLSGLIGWGLSIKDLRRWLVAPPRQPSAAPAATEAVDDDKVIESWEEEVQEYAVAPLSSAPVTRNLFLTKLSLAFPPSSVSWSDLLSLSKHLGMLTHLSLAGWPIPTRTPNMKTASYASKMQAENAASATTLYSASDNDFDESTMILRRLSENTYCLRWLDLEGCASWLPALVWQGSRSDWSTAATEWEQRRGARGPDWRGSWRNVA